MKLQQLKAYQPPKLDYLNNKNEKPSKLGQNMSEKRSQKNSIPHGKSIKIGHSEPRQKVSSVQRNDQTRESLQSRLIERIHNKKIQNGNNFSKKKFSNQLYSI
jgi:hypothetical protein